MKTFSISFFLILLCVGANAAEVRWTDPDTGTHYLNLSMEAKYVDAARACRARGWDIFNFAYLNDTEKKNFLSAPELDELLWVTRYPGEPGERSEATVWMSSESGVVAQNFSRSLSTLTLVRRPGSEPLEPKPGWADYYAESKNVVCMYQSHTWIGCSHEVECIFEEGTGSFSIRYPIYEYGRDKAEALGRIAARAANWKHVGARCDLKARDPHCIDFRQR
ncbi:MAG: hypothetical protein R3B54_01910 [Bdellovibrionota bacterium]